jgi:hypothetical protein
MTKRPKRTNAAATDEHLRQHLDSTLTDPHERDVYLGDDERGRHNRQVLLSEWRDRLDRRGWHYDPATRQWWAADDLFDSGK